MSKPTTLGELKASGYQSRTVREEMRHNLMLKLANQEDVFPGIIGYQDSVIPQIQNAILSGQDIILLGERGQAKSRIIRSLTNLLDDEIPILDGVEIPENPLTPMSSKAKSLISEHMHDARIRWLPRGKALWRETRDTDITIADLIGEIDPIKIAEGRYLSDEEALHFGLIPHSNRGIFTATNYRISRSGSSWSTPTSWRSGTFRFAVTKSAWISMCSSWPPPTQRTIPTVAVSSRHLKIAMAHRFEPTILKPC